ncbi:MAG: NUDIX domain-containing protein [Nitrososphaerota archaeon]|nr:NUDIX domain-containing protein [Nitrososphaerota archaeon]MDG6940039.1 NUDIX domain-containing protein [Nitrososphaerota archaeon]
METSSGGVIFYRAGSNGPRYLLMVNRKGYWEFPKGHIDEGETDEQAALREVKEETGLGDLKILPGFKAKIRYTYRKWGQEKPKEVLFFLMETKPATVQVSDEHQGFLWLGYEDAIRKISYDNARRVLEEAQAFLRGRDGLFRA